ncbi:MAG: HD domain-containing protein [Chloroflexi bacterium]|nr:HD domain-containing protein [Chloroflexota bacterium]
MDALVEELRRYVKQEKLSVKQVASKLDITFKTVQPWFTDGKSHAVPSRANLRKIEEFLHPETHPKLGTVDTQSATSSALSKEIQMENAAQSREVVLGRGKTIRDSVHMDVGLSSLEVKIIDTPAFQRLRHIKQLGTANLVFPGATHTRFDHSLGTVAAAQTMIDAVNNNPDNKTKIESPVKDLIRLCALLHDVTHMPFGHTLEDEGFLFNRHDDAAKDRGAPWRGTRWELFLGEGTEIGAILGDDRRMRVLQYLTTKGDEVNKLDYPFVVDMVGNTVCADLIDYLARDTYYAGLRESFDPRFMRNLTIASYTPPNGAENHGKAYHNRLALSLLKEGIVRRGHQAEICVCS